MTGLSTASFLQEILSEITDKPATRRAAQSLARPKPFPKTERYIWELPSGTKLPHNVHFV